MNENNFEKYMAIYPSILTKEKSGQNANYTRQQRPQMLNMSIL